MCYVARVYMLKVSKDSLLQEQGWYMESQSLLLLWSRCYTIQPVISQVKICLVKYQFCIKEILRFSFCG